MFEGSVEMADWKSELQKVFGKHQEDEAAAGRGMAQSKAKVPGFFKLVVLPAFVELKEQLEKLDRQVEVREHEDCASLEVKFKDEVELYYGVQVLLWPSHAHVYVVTKMRDGGQRLRGESAIKRGSEDSVDNITKQDIIADFLRLYKGQIGRPRGIP